jgi:hypothetical protein
MITTLPSSALGCLRVELLAELHDVDAVLAERRTQSGGAGFAWPAGDLQLDVAC